MTTNREMISALKYNDSFRDALRNYYSYGFLCLQSFGKSRRKTISDNWERLNRILDQYIEWSYASGDSRAVMFATTDSQSLLCNPFHSLFRYCICNAKDAAYFFHMVCALSGKVHLNTGVRKPALPDEEVPQGYDPERWAEALACTEALELDRYKKTIPDGKKIIERQFEPLGVDWDYRIRLAKAVYKGTAMTTSELICFYPDGMPLFSGENNKHKDRLEKLEHYGYVHRLQGQGKRGGTGDRSWQLDALTFGKLLKEAEESGAASDKFRERFLLALDYYSRCHILGEAGSFLLARAAESKEKKWAESPFRFKHDYFMQSVNDFNFADLMCCIERKRWCILEYMHGTKGSRIYILCYPLELRISSMTGREFLMYYDPFMRCCTSLRIDYIESIQQIAYKDVKRILHLPGRPDMDIKKCRKIISRIWGVSAGPPIPGNAAADSDEETGQTGAVKVEAEISYDRDNEYRVDERIERERRYGRWDPDTGIFEVEVMDPGELRPWLRGLYSRIRKCSGMDGENFSIRSDVQDIAEKLLHSTFLTRRIYRKDQWIKPEIPYLYLNSLKEAAEPVREHDKIFNETQGVYCRHIAYVLGGISKERYKGNVSAQELEQIMRNSICRERTTAGTKKKNIGKTMDTLRELLLKSGILYEKNGRIVSRYVFENGADFYRDILPLSGMEKRWLMSILNDPRINVFFNKAETAVIRKILRSYDDTLRPFPAAKIVYYDSGNISPQELKAETAAAAVLLQCIIESESVDIGYRPRGKDMISQVYDPVIIEYSRKNNRLRGFFRSHADGKIYEMNLSEIVSVKPAGRKFDKRAALKAYDDFQKNSPKSVEIEFYDIKDMSDRLLTEFSPWRKQCICDAGTGRYHLTIYYREKDEKELAVRLMGYGADIDFPDKEHAVYREIAEKITGQMKALRPAKRKQKER